MFKISKKYQAELEELHEKAVAALANYEIKIAEIRDELSSEFDDRSERSVGDRHAHGEARLGLGGVGRDGSPHPPSLHARERHAYAPSVMRWSPCSKLVSSGKSSPSCA